LDLEPIQKKDFYPYVRSCPNVVACNCVTGDYSMLLEVLFASTFELDKFINELQHFGKTKTQIVFSTPVEHRDVLPKDRS
jgi:Lrp/AsnC family leucine-responsive transcriptional regulator